MQSRTEHPTILHALSAARRLGVHRQRLHEWLANDPTLQAARAEALDVLLDQAEDVVVAGIRAGDHRAAFFALRTLGQRRGYREGMEVGADPQGRIPVSPAPD